MKKTVFTLTFLLTAFASFAQAPQNVEMADVMRSNGKIYVVLAVVLVILGGLIGYLVSIDRKLSRLEKDASSKVQYDTTKK